MTTQPNQVTTPSHSKDGVDLSIVIPAYNEEKYLSETIRAIQIATKEIDASSELIVVNDNSNDATESIARELGATVANVHLRNIGAVRNAGANKAKGRWLLFVDADTIVPPETLIETMEKLNAGWIGGGARVALEDLTELPWAKRMMYYSVVFTWQKVGRWAAGCYMFCEAKAFRDMGGFDERYFAGEEYFFSRSLKRLGQFGLVKSPVLTSSRKLHGYSTFQLIRFIVRPFFSFQGWFRTRKGLEILYEDDR